MDRTGERTPVDGVKGCGGGLDEEVTASSAFKFSSVFVIPIGWALALSWANASQNALCVTKLSLLHHQQPQKIIISRRLNVHITYK